MALTRTQSNWFLLWFLLVVAVLGATHLQKFAPVSAHAIARHGPEATFAYAEVMNGGKWFKCPDGRERGIKHIAGKLDVWGIVVMEKGSCVTAFLCESREYLENMIGDCEAESKLGAGQER
jgi:hypothetical protein